MRISFIAASLTAVASLGCTATLEQDEEQPFDTRDNELEQGMYDCSERPDTGYTQGNAFTITVVTVDGKPLEVATANAYVVMQQAAAVDGVDLRVVSGFRTMDEQTYLYGCYTNCNCNSCNLAARPGYSNHQSGHALDLNTSDGGVYDWLNAHGGDFGFARTVPSEIWHWEWWGGGPGGGPCGADQACIDDHNYGGCDGTVITNCDADNHIGSGDCGAFGAGCSVEGGTPHCVHPYCLMNLNGGEDGTFCTDDTKVGTCTLGQYSEGDCAAYGGKCGEEGGSGHCIHFMCWSNLNGAEDGTFCSDDNTLGTCAVGAYTETACATGCVVDGGAHCAGDEPPPPPPNEATGTPPPGDGTPDGPSDPGDDAGDGAAPAGGAPKPLPPSVGGGCAAIPADFAGFAAFTLLGILALARTRRSHRGET